MRFLSFSLFASCGSLRAEDPHENEGRCDGQLGTELGNEFVGFAFESCDGEILADESLPPGQPYVFNVSTGWCISCRTETPGFQTFYASHSTEAAIVQILYQKATTEPADPIFCGEWVRSFGAPLTYPVLIDPDGDVATYFGDVDPSASMPLNLVVDRAGCVAGRWIGSEVGEPLGTLSALL